MANSTTLIPLNETLKVCEVTIDSTTAKVAKITAYCCLSLFAILGNCSIVAVVYRDRRLRTTVNFFIVNMAISDLLIPILTVTRKIKDIMIGRDIWLVDGISGAILCKVSFFAEDVSTLVSIQSLLFIAGERFFAVVYPTRRPPVNHQNCATLIAVTWLVALVTHSFYFYTFKLVQHDFGVVCIYRWEPALDTIKAYNLHVVAMFVLYFAGPITILIALYSAIVVSLYRQRIHHYLASEERKRREMKNRKITFMLITVVAVFALTWIPWSVHTLAIIVWNLRPPCPFTDRNFRFTAIFLSYINTVLNPLIYYNFNECFNLGVKSLWQRLCFVTMFGCRKKVKVNIQSQRKEAQTAIAEASHGIRELSFISLERMRTENNTYEPDHIKNQ